MNLVPSPKRTRVQFEVEAVKLVDKVPDRVYTQMPTSEVFEDPGTGAQEVPLHNDPAVVPFNNDPGVVRLAKWYKEIKSEYQEYREVVSVDRGLARKAYEANLAHLEASHEADRNLAKKLRQALSDHQEAFEDYKFRAARDVVNLVVLFVFLQLCTIIVLFLS